MPSGRLRLDRGSVAAAGTRLPPAVDATPAGTDLVADGISCRTGLDRLAGRPARHRAELVADLLSGVSATGRWSGCLAPTEW